MGTYDHKQVLSEYANGRMAVEMAVGHSLQHIDKLYELLTNANVNRYELRGKIDTLEHKVMALQSKVDRLTAQLEKLRPRRKRNASTKPQKDKP